MALCPRLVSNPSQSRGSMSLDLSGIFKTEDSSLVEEEANPHVCD